MNKITFLFFVILLVSACRPCDEPIVIDNGKIPDSILSYIPYQNGLNYKFRHSGGLVIGFSAVRASNEAWLECHRCCKFVYKYEENITTLIPDYPIFNIGFNLANMDSSFCALSAWVGHDGFSIPANDYQAGFVGFADSILIGDKVFYNVFKIKSDYSSGYNRETIYTDSIYYSYQHGLIQIKMSNGEKYTIYE